VSFDAGFVAVNPLYFPPAPNNACAQSQFRQRFHAAVMYGCGGTIGLGGRRKSAKDIVRRIVGDQHELEGWR
jgi:hypothetical protein